MSGRGRGGRGRHIRNPRIRALSQRVSPRPARRREVIAEEGVHVEVLLLVTTFAFVIFLAKFCMLNTVDQMIANIQGLWGVISLFGTLFAAFGIVGCWGVVISVGRHRKVMDSFRMWLEAGRNKIPLVRKRFNWLRNFLARHQPSSTDFMRMHQHFKRFYGVYSLFFGVQICYSLAVGNEMKYLANFLLIILYYFVAFFYSDYQPQHVIAHFGFSLMQVGVLLSNFQHAAVGFICLTLAFVTFILFTLWNFLRVPRRN